MVELVELLYLLNQTAWNGIPETGTKSESLGTKMIFINFEYQQNKWIIGSFLQCLKDDHALWFWL